MRRNSNGLELLRLPELGYAGLRWHSATKFQEEDDFGPNPCDDSFLNELPENAVLFALTESGMACGPTGITVVHGIKFSVNEMI